MSGSLTRKLTVALALLLLVPTVVLGGALLILERSGVFERDPSTRLWVLVVGFVVFVVFVYASVLSLGRGLARAVQRLQLDTELMSTVNPSHRIDLQTGDELERLAADVNRLADTAHAARAT